MLLSQSAIFNRSNYLPVVNYIALLMSLRFTGFSARFWIALKRLEGHHRTPEREVSLMAPLCSEINTQNQIANVPKQSKSQ